jgi:hypothetical protein
LAKAFFALLKRFVLETELLVFDFEEHLGASALLSLLRLAHRAHDRRDKLGQMVFMDVIGRPALDDFPGASLAHHPGHDNDRHIRRNRLRQRQCFGPAKPGNVIVG